MPGDKIDPKKPVVGIPPSVTGFADDKNAGVSGTSLRTNQPGVFADGGIGIQARGTTFAGVFEGDVKITGNCHLIGSKSDLILENEDCAEQFNVSDGASQDAGLVMVLDDQGLLRPSQLPYDKRVAGVISGAGSFRPAVTLGVRDSDHNRVPIALLGKVYCWADADIHPIGVGDLLTSSTTAGHAMAASEPTRAFGTIIGKALEPLANGRKLIPILVALQ
jgi:hypothetical protein